MSKSPFSMVVDSVEEESWYSSSTEEEQDNYNEVRHDTKNPWLETAKASFNKRWGYEG
jgi:hypothetical protein